MESGLQRDISNTGVQLRTFGQMVKLSKGQSGLLRVMRECVEKNKSLNWDIIVMTYYKNVRSYQSDTRWVGEHPNRKQEWFQYDIWEAYKDQGAKWRYTLRSRIKQWFVSSIGILVIKNQLVVIPTIEVGEDNADD